MAETGTPTGNNTPEAGTPPAPGGRSKEEIALELMRFIASTTGYGKSAGSAGFSGKPVARTPEEQADALLELFQRCRKIVNE